MANKRYYWLKFMDNFFEEDEIKVIQSHRNGDKYIVFWLKLLLKSIKQKEIGLMRFKDNMPYSPELLSTTTGVNIDIVKGAMELFLKLEMLEVKENGNIWIEKATQLVGSETNKAESMRQLRDRRKVTMLPDVTDSYIELEKELDIDKDKENPPPAGCNIFNSKKESPLTRACGLFKNRSWCFQDKDKCKMWDVFNGAVKIVDPLYKKKDKAYYGALHNQVMQAMDKQAESLSSWANEMHNGKRE